jgi:hypothetical protein
MFSKMKLNDVIPTNRALILGFSHKEKEPPLPLGED